MHDTTAEHARELICVKETRNGIALKVFCRFQSPGRLEQKAFKGLLYEIIYFDMLSAIPRPKLPFLIRVYLL